MQRRSMLTSAFRCGIAERIELMSAPSNDSDLPFPLTPSREPAEWPAPVAVPVVESGSDPLRDRLIDQRRILVSGPLDGAAITDLAAQLMALDGLSSRHIEIVITSPGGPMAEVFAVLDVLDLMRAKVNVTVIGSVSGTAVALVAACSGERRAGAHTTFSLRLDASQSIEGTAGDLVRHADELSRLRSRYLEALAVATGHDEAALAVEIDRGPAHSSEEAIAMGVIDTATGRS